MKVVYPRVCGGTPGGRSKSGGPTGLSPRVRGNLLRLRFAAINAGSIPACAGEPRHTGIDCHVPGVYPRVCGGTKMAIDTFAPQYGLSPRVRGNRVDPYPRPGQCGSIPACAGEPGRVSYCTPSTPVYPRVCGGTASAGANITGAHGLSPRVRGNPRAGHVALRHRGSIPACAGEPLRAGGVASKGGVYPRVCGGTSNRRRTPRLV